MGVFGGGGNMDRTGISGEMRERKELVEARDVSESHLPSNSNSGTSNDILRNHWP